jgi:hypothetical protein
MRGGSVAWGAIILDGELVLGKCLFQMDIIRDRARRHDVVETATTTALVGHATSAAATAVGVAPATV